MDFHPPVPVDLFSHPLSPYKVAAFTTFFWLRLSVGLLYAVSRKPFSFCLVMLLLIFQLFYERGTSQSLSGLSVLLVILWNSVIFSYFLFKQLFSGLSILAYLVVFTQNLFHMCDRTHCLPLNILECCVLSDGKGTQSCTQCSR